METLRNSATFQDKTLTVISNIFFIWVLWHFGLGGEGSLLLLLKAFGLITWVLLAGIIFLMIYHSNYRVDLPLFTAGFLLGYWGEWWGTTRGVWWYWNAATPPDYLPPLWGLGLLTVFHLSQLLLPLIKAELTSLIRMSMLGSFFLLPLITLTYSWTRLMQVDWGGRLDLHFAAGLVVAITLILYRFDLRRDFLIYISGTILGLLYEYLGTSIGEWTYVTAEEPPVWIAPLWGLAAVAMVSLAEIITRGVEAGWSRIRKIWSQSLS